MMKKITFMFILFFISLFSIEMSAQLNEGFDTAGLPTGWTQTYISATVDWVSGATANQNSSISPNTGAGMAYFYAGNYNGDTTRLESPTMDLTSLTTPTLTFYYTQVDWSGDQDQLSLYYKTSAGGAWTLINTYSSSITAWEKIEVILPSPSADYYIAFEGQSGYGRGITLDDVQVAEAPSCVDPDTFASSNVTTNTVDLSWNDPSGIQFDFEYVVQASGVGIPGGSGVAVGANSATGISTEVDTTPLAPNTAYEAWVRADCGGGDYSAWVGPIYFNTACTAFTVPFTEGFNSTSTSESCWTVLNENGDGDSWNTSYATNPYEGDEAAMIYTDFNSGANDDWLISPTITLTGNQRLKFHYRVQSAGEPNDFELLLSTTGTAPASFTNTLIANTSYDNTTYVEQVVDLSAFSGDVNIAWHVPNGGLDGWRLYIDNVIVEDIPACPEPTGLSVINITDTTADLSWTATTGNYEYVLDMNAADPTGTGTAIAGETYNATGLTPETTYYFHVRSDCGSTWTTISFTTLATPPANDDCANAEVLTPGAVFTDNPVVGTNVGATDSGETAPGCASYSGGDVWYSVQVPASGSITVESNSNSDGITDTGLAVYSGSCGSLTLIECDDDDSADGLFSMVALTGRTPGETLYINVWEYGNDVTGSFQVSAYDASLSANSFDSNSFVAYPNPVKDVLTLEYSNEITNVSVYNMLGQEVLSRTIEATSTQIDMSSLNAGTYLVNVSSGDIQKTIKVVKQ